jgi:sugar phosphate isomerase/epimerase
MLQAAAVATGSSAAVPARSGELTKFQIACKTNPYYPFSFERALQGIAGAGYRFIAWGNRYTNSAGEREELLGVKATPADAKRVATRCRDAGLQPVMMASKVSIVADDTAQGHTRLIEQAAAAEIRFIILAGSTRRGNYEAWIRNLKRLGPIARSNNVTLVIKPHGGNTSTGKDCAWIVSEVGDEGVRICYDSGNVLDYVNVDPIPDIQACWPNVRAFIIKDHRDTPKDQDCGPGFGEIDHYKLLMPVIRTGLTMPLACENIFEPLLPRPATAEGVDALARRAREFLETVIRGLQSV